MWEENWDAIQIFCRLSTQWRVGMNGPTSLDHLIVYKELDRIGISGEEFDEILSRLHIIENEALKQIHEG